MSDNPLIEVLRKPALALAASVALLIAAGVFMYYGTIDAKKSPVDWQAWMGVWLFAAGGVAITISIGWGAWRYVMYSFTRK